MEIPSVESLPYEVKVIEIQGHNRTKLDIIENCLEPIKAAQTIGDVFYNTVIAQQRLKAMGIFKTVQFTIQKENEETLSAPAATSTLIYFPRKNSSDPIRHFCKLNLKLEEKTKEGSISLNMDSEGVSTQVSGTILNTFGRAEKISTKLTMHSARNNTLELSFSKPLLLSGAGDTILNVQVNQSEWDYSRYCSYTEKIRGITANICRNSIFWRQIFSYEGSWRDIRMEPQASMRARESAGDSVKSSLKYSVSYDRRDDEAMPTRGHAFNYLMEFAGLGGNVRFFKQELGSQLNFPIANSGWVNRISEQFFIYLDEDRFSLQVTNVCLRGGSLYPFGGYRSCVNDRFFLGGPITFRGFRLRGIGPITPTDSLGGDFYVAGGVHLVSPPLHVKDQPVILRTQLFMNFGNLMSPNKNMSILDNALLLRDEMRTSLGVGVVARTGFGRLEINYSYPIRTFGYDKERRWQVGMMFNFS